MCQSAEEGERKAIKGEPPIKSQLTPVPEVVVGWRDVVDWVNDSEQSGEGFR